MVEVGSVFAGLSPHRLFSFRRLFITVSCDAAGTTRTDDGVHALLSSPLVSACRFCAPDAMTLYSSVLHDVLTLRVLVASSRCLFSFNSAIHNCSGSFVLELYLEILASIVGSVKCVECGERC